jgi:Na+/alanine symporter
MTADSTEPNWKIRTPDLEAPAGPGSGPSWQTKYVTDAVQRIESATSVATASVQALAEQVVVLHSIRRILMWTLVLIPLVAIAIVLIASAATAATG